MSEPPSPFKVSAPPLPMTVSLPEPPFSMSLPPPPVSLLFVLDPVRVSALEEPRRFSSSTNVSDPSPVEELVSSEAFTAVRGSGVGGGVGPEPTHKSIVTNAAE